MSQRQSSSDSSDQSETLVAQAERRFFARRSSGETLVVSGEERPLTLIQRVLELTITFGILLLVALSTANSIYIAGWVAEMPDLRITAAAGVLIALVLGRVRRLRAPFAMVVAIIVGGLIIMAQVTQLETLGGQPLFWEPIHGFRLSFSGLVQAGLQRWLDPDNLPFVFFTDVFVYHRLRSSARMRSLAGVMPGWR